MRQYFIHAALILGCTLCVQGQTPRIYTSVYNAASYATPVAPGSIITIRGENLGPRQLEQASGYPLPTSLAGTSVEITIGRNSFRAPLLYTSATQIAAVLPSSTPVGDATVSVSYNGATSARERFSIVRAFFGAFTASASGRGPGAAQNVMPNGAVELNTLTAPARPNGIVVLYGTGLGAVPHDETQTPSAAEVPDANVEVFVGGKRAQVLYAGRSGCCAGLDQLNLVIPEGVSGCYVPVLVRSGGTTLSNSATISIRAGESGPCSDDYGRAKEQHSHAQTEGQLAEAKIVVFRHFAAEHYGPFILPIQSEGVSATFARYSFTDLLRSTGFTVFGPPVAPGSCFTYAWGQHVSTGVAPEPIDVVKAEPLDAGSALTLDGPGGTRTIPRTPSGDYKGNLMLGPAPFLRPGTYSVTNGSGGAHIGSFTTQITIPAAARWTNEDSTTVITRSAGYEATWTGADPSGFAYVSGRAGGDAGVAFTCFERASAGRLFVPPYILESIPHLDHIGVGTVTQSNQFSAAGLQSGSIVFLDYREKSALFR